MPKKRAHGDGGLFYLPSRGLWRGAVDVGFGPDGRRKQKYVHGKTQTEARRKLNALKDEIAKYGAPLDNNMTVERWATHWLDTVCRPHMKPAPYKGYVSNVRTWIVPTIGQKRVAQLKPSDLRAVTQAIVRAGRSSSTALKVHNIMGSMLESARLDGIVGRNVARDVVAPKAAAVERGALSTDDALAVLRVAAGQVDGTRWWVALLAGMRQGERLGATIDSLDLDGDEPTFTVQWSLTEAKFEHGCVKGDAKPAQYPCGKKQAGACPQRRLIVADDLEYRQLAGRLCLVRPKSGRPRTFPLIPALAEALRRYLAATADVPNPHGLIWRRPDGSPMTAAEDNDAWRALLLEAGIITDEQAKRPKDRAPGTEEPPTTHWARHTTATVLMELGVDARIVGEIVGHSSTRITARYQHVSSPAARAAANALGTHFAKALTTPAA